jgi:hypothetical protein
MRTLIFGLMEIVWATAAGTGPILGGTITQELSWVSLGPRTDSRLELTQS